MSRDPRVDDYIARAAPFAQPILTHIREAIHAACPQVEEAIKWSAPAFLYRGKLLAGMAAFKAHAALGFWHGEQVTQGNGAAEGMGQFGRLTGIDDLPPEAELHAMIAEARALIDEGAVPVRGRTPRPALPLPDDLDAALRANPAAQAVYDGFSPSCRREYVEWVTEAKRPETRARRVAQAVEWMAEGKQRNWKYQNC